MNIPIYLLTAGASMRTKSIAHKALLSYNNMTLLKYQIETGCLFTNKIVIITGSDADEIIAHCQKLDCNIQKKISFWHCENWKLGRSFSLSFLFKTAMRQKEQALFLVNIDQPLSIEVLSCLYQAYCVELQGNIFLPSFMSKPGHPLLIKHDVFEELSYLYKQPRSTLRDLLYRHTVITVDVNDNIIFKDLNTLEDFKKVR